MPEKEGLLVPEGLLRLQPKGCMFFCGVLLLQFQGNSIIGIVLDGFPMTGLGRLEAERL